RQAPAIPRLRRKTLSTGSRLPATLPRGIIGSLYWSDEWRAVGEPPQSDLLLTARPIILRHSRHAFLRERLARRRRRASSARHEGAAADRLWRAREPRRRDLPPGGSPCSAHADGRPPPGGVPVLPARPRREDPVRDLAHVAAPARTPSARAGELRADQVLRHRPRLQ